MVRPRNFSSPRFASLFALVASLSCCATAAHGADSDVRLSSAGFLPDRVKEITVRGNASEYSIKDADSDEEVLNGELEGADDPEALTVIDISELEEGRYYVEVVDHGRSIPFSVADDVYDDAFLLSMLAFYGWRSGIDIAFEHQGVSFGHGAGHLDDGLLDYVGFPGEVRDGTGGWYDAGDYGKYTINGSFAVGQMLTAWVHFEDKLTDLTLPIPESGGELPDYLAELRYQLEWLLKMQITGGDDVGAAYEKLTPTRFAGFVQPADDTRDRYFAPHGSTPTASFAAAMAQGARVFRPYDEAFADQMEAASVLAWQWLVAHPEHLPPASEDFSTGDYDSDDKDERLWAAAELFETTGEAEYLAAFETAVIARNKLVDTSWDWPRVGNMGIYTYALSAREGRDPDVVSAIEEDLASTAEELGGRSNLHPFGRGEGYYWGSNGSVVRSCMTLQVAYRIDPDDEYLDTCTEQLSYVFGRNEYNRSQVTGFGIDPPLFPHHRLSGSDDVSLPYPGMLVGGANEEGNWSDQQGSYTTNEVAINWNAALVYALAGFTSGEALEYDGTEGGTQGALPGPPPPPPPAILDLIDDLEDGDLSILENDGRSGEWYTSSDNTGDDVTLENTDDSSHEGERSVSATGSGYTMWGAGLGLTFRGPTSAPEPYDASAYTGFTFWVRANEGLDERMRILVRDTQTDPSGGECTNCYDHFMATVVLTDEWQQVHVRFADLRQQGFGDAAPSLRVDELVGLEFQTPANVDLDVRMDDLGFVNENVTVEEGPDSGPIGPFAIDDGGCGCRAAGTSNPHAPWLAIGALLGGLALTRRVRSRRPS